VRKVLLLILLPAGPPGPAGPFELHEGDRVAFVGDAFVERDLHHNYLEAFLAERFAGRRISFRNLGWSGDTVFGHARAGFGGPEDGFRALARHLAELKPTVIFLAYGMNESFEGEAGLPEFRRGLDRLLDAVAALGPRAVFLVSPLRHENLGPPLPDPTEHNRHLRLYADALRGAAEARRLGFIDLFERLDPEGRLGPLTDNGIHLTARGYRRAAEVILEALALEPAVSEVPVHLDGAPLRARREALPGGEARWRIEGLRPGRYALRIDGAPAASAAAGEWARGVHVARGPDVERFERLREAIRAKNFLYFNRWRPQNDTYIFGFRKREQGHLAPEIPQFDPLVEAKEKEIAEILAPAPRAYVLEAAP
jgi:lysophospholipase L1-like esterase